MFASHAYLKRKTPEKGGINRQEFIEHLVEEYHDSTNVEAQEQVTANLANFAYDPINWNYLKQAEALELFVNLLRLPNIHLQLHGLAGLCNICLDHEAHQLITYPINLAILLELFLKSENTEIILNCITLFYQLLNTTESKEVRQAIITPAILKRFGDFRQTDDRRLVNLVTVFLEDYGSRTEIVDLRASNEPNTETLL